MMRFTTITGLMMLASLVSACAAMDALNLEAEPGSRLAAGTPTGVVMPPAGENATDDGSQPTAQESAAVAAIPANARVQFAPVIGAAPETLPGLSSRLSARAGQRGIAITPQSTGATHIVKGYFSAIADENQTTVIYVWDVLDPSGNRLHRIQGQQKVPGNESAGWASVKGETMDAIADRTIDELATWLGRSNA